MFVEWIVPVIVVVIVLFVVLLYNNLIRARNNVKNAWAQIDVQLKRRNDLIPKLVESVKGYMKHERGVLTDVTKARTTMLDAQTTPQKAEASNMITNALKSIFAVAENYPNLKANENFIQLQQEISGTENKISFSRQFYNDSVTTYNNKIQVFPNKILAGPLGFKTEGLFEAAAEERKDVSVKF
ncbi:LemA family protein [Candidatus Micrarchaeota archaeon]|nr:LemA family protein [Candidatus Micrarchaeota archaeon]